jgi:hypothetical protein
LLITQGRVSSCTDKENDVREEETGGFAKTLEEFETRLGQYGWTVSRQEEQDVGRALLRQAVTGRQGEFMARAVCTRRTLEDGADQVDFNYTGAYTPSGDERVRWSMFRTQDELLRFAHEYDITLLKPSGPPPSTGRRGSRCRCGKVRHASRGRADKVLAKIKRERQRVGSTQRTEERVYPCPLDKTVFHLTSLEDWVDEVKEKQHG